MNRDFGRNTHLCCIAKWLPVKLLLPAAACALFFPGTLHAQTGYITTVAGNTSFGYTGNNGPATKAELNTPGGVALDATGNLYIADTYNNVIRRADAKTQIITTFAGNGYKDKNGFGAYAGDGHPASEAEFFWPQSVCLDAFGNLYIADTWNNVIRRVDAKSLIITTIAGNGYGAGTGAGGYSGDGVAATKAELSAPQGVALDNTGNIYFADTGNNVIRKINAVNGTISTVAGQRGTGGYSGDGGLATKAELHQPQDVAFDSSNNLYIADTVNHVIRRVDAKTGGISTVAGNGAGAGCISNTTCSGPYFSGDGGLATKAELYLTSGVAVDGAGSLFIADIYNNRIRRVDAKTQIITTIAGNGSCTIKNSANDCYSGDGGPAINAELAWPSAVAFSIPGDLYLVDGNNVIRKVQASGAPAVVAKPVFTPPAGIYAPPQSIAIADATPNTTIYFTTDGSAPNTNSKKYTAVINLSGTTIIKAIATAAGYANNAANSATYTIEPAAASPEIKPATGRYGLAQLVTITDATSGAAIHYTTDGSAPSAGSATYATGFIVAGNTTIKAMATAGSHVNSTVESAAITIADGPAVLTYPATAVATPNATLNGLAGCPTAPTTVWFIYGTNSASLTSVTAKATIATSNTLQHFNALLTTLSPKTTYYFRPVASTLGGTDYGALANFTTN